MKTIHFAYLVILFTYDCHDTKICFRAKMYLFQHTYCSYREFPEHKSGPARPDEMAAAIIKPVSGSCVRRDSTEDLMHIPGPITEAAILKTLASRFEAKIYQVL